VSGLMSLCQPLITPTADDWCRLPVADSSHYLPVAVRHRVQALVHRRLQSQGGRVIPASRSRHPASHRTLSSDPAQLCQLGFQLNANHVNLSLTSSQRGFAGVESYNVRFNFLGILGVLRSFSLHSRLIVIQILASLDQV